MFSHMVVGSNDLERSKNFYDSLFAAIGGKPGRVDEKGRLSYARNGTVFMVTSPIDGRQATHGNGATIGFTLDSPDQIDAWHDAGVASGGKSIEDPPGLRQGSFGPLYLAYLRDPDGNKLCGLYRVPQ
jgi:catechol 2,3-dioxygenase-like lactoylglutathione lyase family enzyme